MSVKSFLAGTTRIDYKIYFRRFAQGLSADRDRLRRYLPESISTGCFPRLQGAQSELSRPTIHVACTNRQPISPQSPGFPSVQSAPRGHEFDRDHLLRRGPLARAVSCARCSSISGVTVPIPSIQEEFFPWAVSHS